MVSKAGGLWALLARAKAGPVPALPAWLADAGGCGFHVAEFARTGLRGGLNWYRNIDRNWELLAGLAGARVTVPVLFMAGERDPVLAFPGVAEAVATLGDTVPGLREVVMLPRCGHWLQQERPNEVNAAMVRFIFSL